MDCGGLESGIISPVGLEVWEEQFFTPKVTAPSLHWMHLESPAYTTKETREIPLDIS